MSNHWAFQAAFFRSFIRMRIFEMNLSANSLNRSAAVGEMRALDSCATRLRNLRSSLRLSNSSCVIRLLSLNAIKSSSAITGVVSSVLTFACTRTSLAAASTSFHDSITTPVGLYFRASSSVSDSDVMAATLYLTRGSSTAGYNSATGVTFFSIASSCWLNFAAKPPGSVSSLTIGSKARTCLRSIRAMSSIVNGHASADVMLDTKVIQSTIPPELIDYLDGILARLIAA